MDRLRASRAARALIATLAWPSLAAAEAPRKSDPWRFGQIERLDLAALLGAHHRLDAPPALTLDAPTSFGGGIELRVFAARRVAFTLGWERFGIGHEITGIRERGSASIARSADAVWLGVRLDPFAGDRWATFLALGGGPSFQRASAAGSTWPAAEPGAAQPFECSAGGRVAPGLRIDLGGEALLAAGLRAFASTGFGTFGFGDGVLGTCAGGAGSTRSIAVRFGLAYSFDFAKRAGGG